MLPTIFDDSFVLPPLLDYIDESFDMFDWFRAKSRCFDESSMLTSSDVSPLVVNYICFSALSFLPSLLIEPVSRFCVTLPV